MSVTHATTPEGRRWGFLGAGKMASALIQGMIRAEVAAASAFLASDPVAGVRERLAATSGVRVTPANRAVVEGSDVLVLAVKPQVMTPLLAEIRPLLTGNHLVISIAAGITLRQLAQGLGEQTRLVRVMPNTPALVGAGASGYSLGTNLHPGDEAVVRSCLEAVGRAVAVPETLIDAVTAVSGSGPAYIYLVIEALADGGVGAGLARDVAQLLAAQTVLGAARMVLETGEHPGVLKDQVASPGGTTIAGLRALERGGLRTTLIEAVAAAALRAAELGGLREST